MGSAGCLILGGAADAIDTYCLWGTMLGARDRMTLANIDVVPALVEHVV